MRELTVERLRELLDYNAETGEFFWKVSRGYIARKGSKAGTTNNRGYLVIKIDGKIYQAHRLAWYHFYGEWPKDMISHENENKTNNKIDNLKDTNASGNKHNDTFVQANKKSRLPRVVFRNGNYFQAQIKLNCKIEYLGIYKTVEEAEAAYLKRKQEILNSRK